MVTASSELPSNIPNAPSSVLISSIDRMFEEDSGIPSDEQFLQYELYKFIESMVVIFGELRHKAEEQASCRRDELNFRLETDLPLDWDTASKLFVPHGKEPPLELIAQISSSYRHKLLKLSSSPRKVLRKIRRKEHLSRVQQMDTNCLMWFIRQPGRNALEKAGSRQEIFAVAREEIYNTLENRVLKSMISLSHRAARGYYRKFNNSRKYKTSERLSLIQRFSLETRSILQSKIFEGIVNLHRTPKPNYVLMFDANYREMWHWYLRLVRQQEETEASWKWQQYLFADWCKFATTVALLRIPGCRTLFKHEVWLRNLPKKGSWFTFSDWPTQLLVSIEEKDYIIDLQCHNSQHLENEDEPIMKVIFRSRNNKKEKTLLLWSFHSPGNECECASLCLKRAIEQVSAKKNQTGIIFCSQTQKGSKHTKPAIVDNVAQINVNGQDSEMAINTIKQIHNVLKLLVNDE
jgi:uncharacterized protein DUF2357